MNDELLAQALKEATTEAKRVERQQNKAEKAAVLAAEKRKVYAVLKDRKDRIREAKREKAIPIFQAHPGITFPLEIVLEHWDKCRKVSPHFEWGSKKRSTPDEYFPMPDHPTRQSHGNCPACMMDIWKKIYDSVSVDESAV